MDYREDSLHIAVGLHHTIIEGVEKLKRQGFLQRGYQDCIMWLS
jgi:hypothetical protein